MDVEYPTNSTPPDAVVSASGEFVVCNCCRLLRLQGVLLDGTGVGNGCVRLSIYACICTAFMGETGCGSRLIG